MIPVAPVANSTRSSIAQQWIRLDWVPVSVLQEPEFRSGPTSGALPGVGGGGVAVDDGLWTGGGDTCRTEATKTLGPSAKPLATGTTTRLQSRAHAEGFPCGHCTAAVVALTTALRRCSANLRRAYCKDVMHIPASCSGVHRHPQSRTCASATKGTIAGYPRVRSIGGSSSRREESAPPTRLSGYRGLQSGSLPLSLNATRRER